MTNDRETPGCPAPGAGIIAVAALAYTLCDLLHELGHLAATLPPLGIKATSISTVGLTTSGSSDWAVVLGAVVPPAIWRPGAGVAGVALYAGCVHVSLRTLRRAVAAGILAERNVDRYCTNSYWVGGLLLTAGAAFNPISPWFILTSGAATGFGAMAGLLVLPRLLSRTSSIDGYPSESLRIGLPWLVSGAVAAGIFLGVFGPGLRLA